jgi:hypothetical protein
VVDQPVGDAGLFGDITDTGGFIALSGEDTDGCGEDQLSLVLGCGHGATPYSRGEAEDSHDSYLPQSNNPDKGWLATSAQIRCRDLEPVPLLPGDLR